MNGEDRQRNWWRVEHKEAVLPTTNLRSSDFPGWNLNAQLTHHLHRFINICSSYYRVVRWMVRGSNSGWGEVFRTRPDRSWGILHNGYRVFPGGKAASVWYWQHTPSRAEVKERIRIYIYSPSGPLRPLLGRTFLYKTGFGFKSKPKDNLFRPFSWFYIESLGKCRVCTKFRTRSVHPTSTPIHYSLIIESFDAT